MRPDGPNYIRDIAQLLHIGDDGVMTMFAAYCDESYGGDGVTTKPYYVVAGFCGPVSSWSRFETYWNATTRELKIEGIGLHASKCANGAGPYKGMAVGKRDDIQHRMIVDIAASKPLMGFPVAIDRIAFEKHKPTLAEMYGRDLAKYNVEHVYAMELCVELMTIITEGVVPDRIAFVFDRNKAFGGRAGEWYNMRVKRPLASHHEKLGAFTQDDRMKLVGLQAADMLAYSAFRRVSDPGRDRWQWRELNQAVHISPILVIDDDFWTDTAEATAAEMRDGIVSNIKGGKPDSRLTLIG